MNRRKFFKATGAAALAPAVPMPVASSQPPRIVAAYFNGIKIPAGRNVAFMKGRAVGYSTLVSEFYQRQLGEPFTPTKDPNP